MPRLARSTNRRPAANITNVVSADQIGSFPDANAAETVQRIPGISITKDQGEGRYVNIRGTDARLNSMMINGERIPAPDPLLRQVALDVVPSELLQAIEVSKALTPDMDADAIGGSVNLVMKTAPEKLRVLGAIGGGYNQMLSSYGQSEVRAWLSTFTPRCTCNRVSSNESDPIARSSRRSRPPCDRCLALMDCSLGRRSRTCHHSSPISVHFSHAVILPGGAET
jgi:outer membrane receptor for Fe3+-dicitrate